MGLFDKIKDNAKTISMKAIDATREYDEDYRPQPPAPETAAEAVIEPIPFENTVVIEPESEFLVDEAQEPQKADTDSAATDKQTESEQVEVKSTRKSKVTEVSKADHEKAEQEKRQAKAKQAAKERLAKSYTPSYKKEVTVKSDDKNDDKKPEVTGAKADSKETSDKHPVKRPIGIIDIAPKKFQSPAKGAGYARERAALSALASQRKLNGAVPLYVTTHMNFKTRVFINRIEYSGSFGKSTLAIEQVSWVKLRAGGTGVIIETTEGKRVVMVIKPSDRLAFADAILKVQALQPKRSKFKDTQTIRIDQLERFNEGVDEIEKLAKLYDKGILSQEEFDTKKKQILGL